MIRHSDTQLARLLKILQEMYLHVDLDKGYASYLELAPEEAKELAQYIEALENTIFERNKVIESLEEVIRLQRK